MAGPGPGPRRTRDEELLLALLTARRRRRRRDGNGKALRNIAVTAIVLVLAAVAGLTVVAAGAIHAALTDCTLAGRTPRFQPVTSFVYAENGSLLGAIPSPTHSELVGYPQISPWVRRATIAAEDRTFWSNPGVDYAGIARAAVADVSAGRAVQGASTITQQLVRNLYLNDDKSLSRKRLEACLALKLTQRESKGSIITQYLNRIPYGAHAIGIEAAARTFFGLPASKLGPAQAALLAGLPQAPSAYDPFSHPAAALARRNEVLRAMARTGTLPQAKARRLMRKPVRLHPGHRYRVQRVPNFFSYVETQLVAAYGRQEVRGGGLKVYTTIDPHDQAVALATIRRTLDRKGDPAAAVVSLDPHSGAIRTLAQGWHGHTMQFDLPADGARQTGSAFKTFVLTDAVLQHHADPNRTWYDSAPFTYQPTPQSKPWSPHTYENTYFGPETLTKATLLSDNVVYAKLTLDLGPRNVARIAHLMGVHSKLQPVPSIGLGANSVTPLALASAYATLASGGVYHHPFAIRKVVLPDGTVDRTHHWGQDRKPARVLPQGVAWTVTQVLEKNVQAGTGIAAQIPGRHVAGKTGTTTNWTDGWFAGYTPRRTTVTWVGYPLHPRPMRNVHGIQVQGASFPAQIWHGYMVGVLGHSRPLQFRRGWWPLRPYKGPRSMGGAPTSRKPKSARSGSGSSPPATPTPAPAPAPKPNPKPAHRPKPPHKGKGHG